MRPLRLAAISTLTAALALLSARPAAAFCGFYVSGADSKLFADATQVVLMRSGTKTVLSMQNDYKGPPEKFALVIPVPSVLTKESVKVLPRDVFDKVDRLGAPRLVEYWEQDPCPAGGAWRGQTGGGSGGGIGLGMIGTLGHGSGADLGVKIEARFEVGEYEIVVLSAKDSGGLDTWLKQEKYAIPDGAEPFLRPYVASGMKFFVAKVDVTKVKFDGGRAKLSPLRFHYDTDKFSLPVRLGMINSSGKQDLIVNILARQTRYETANFPNVSIPTNLDVAESARGRFGEFYAALFDKVAEKNPGAVITEYAWDAGTCDPCPGPTLDGNDLATLGADVLPGGTDGLSPSWGGSGGAGAGPTMREVALSTEGGKLPVEVIRRITRSSFGRFRLCYTNGALTNPKLAGKVGVKYQIDAGGAVQSAVDSGSDLPDPAVRACIARALGSLSFPQPEGGPIKVTWAMAFAPPNPDAGAPPLSVQRFNGSTPYVLTRLHVRYDKTLSDDLVFRAAGAIAGGRESRGTDGALEQGAVTTAVNNFQGRYAIRHPWTGKIECKDPLRNVWGGPPSGGGPTTTPAQNVAFVSRGASLASFVTKSNADLDIKATPLGGTVGALPTATAAASDAGPPEADGGASATPSASAIKNDKNDKADKKGCAASGRAEPDAGLLALFTAVLVGGPLLRRMRRPRRR